MNNTIGDSKSIIDRYNASKVKEFAYYILFSIVYVRAFYEYFFGAFNPYYRNN